jgi:hypothetical protein
MVNGLHDFYIPNNTEHGEIEQRYEKYSRLVDVNLKSDLPKRAKNKWLWFGKYLEAERSNVAKWAGA